MIQSQTVLQRNLIRIFEPDSCTLGMHFHIQHANIHMLICYKCKFTWNFFIAANRLSNSFVPQLKFQKHMLTHRSGLCGVSASRGWWVRSLGEEMAWHCPRTPPPACPPTPSSAPALHTETQLDGKHERHWTSVWHQVTLILLAVRGLWWQSWTQIICFVSNIWQDGAKMHFAFCYRRTQHLFHLLILSQRSKILQTQRDLLR